MKVRIGSAALALCLIALPAASWAKKQRTVEKAYQVATVGSGSIRSTNGVEFESKKGERFVTIAIDDELTTHVPARIGQDFDHDGDDERSNEICTSTERPIKLRGELPSPSGWARVSAARSLPGARAVGFREW